MGRTFMIPSQGPYYPYKDEDGLPVVYLDDQLITDFTNCTGVNPVNAYANLDGNGNVTSVEKTVIILPPTQNQTWWVDILNRLSNAVRGQQGSRAAGLGGLGIRG
jgi:hypothetical protein